MKSPINLEYFLNLIKGVYKKLTANIILSGEGLEWSPMMKSKTKCLLLLLMMLLKNVLAVLGQDNQARKRNKRYPCWKEETNYLHSQMT